MSTTGNSDPLTDPIDDYLDELADRLPLRGRQLRRVLAEVDDHLNAATEQRVRDGLSWGDAARQAVAEFGDADLVARTMTRAGGPATTALLVETFRALLLLGVVGLLAVGASGLLAWSAGGLFGKAFVSGDAPGVAYTAARCADLREYAPGSATCAAAAVSHHFDEVVGYRLAAGVLGLLVLVVWLAVTRPWRRTAGRWQASYGVLPATFVPTVGAALFGAAALMLPYGLLDLVASGAGHGSGALITAGAVSAAAFLGFAVLWWRSLSPRPA